MNSILFAEYHPEANPAKLGDMLARAADKGASCLLAFVSGGEGWEPEALDPVLRDMPVPLLGGIFPGLLWDGGCYEEGIVVAGLDCRPEIAVINGLSEGPAGIRRQLEVRGPALRQGEGFVVLMDGLAANLDMLAEALYMEIGHGKGVVGGGAGHLDFIQRPCLFTHAGMVADAAIVASLPLYMHSGIKHGWEVVAGPHLVSASDRVVLQQLNYEPAYQVYRAQVEAASGQSFEHCEFFDLAKQYPLGIERLDSEILVRDPLRTENDQLVCVGDVPENAMVYLLHGQPPQLVAAAGEAAEAARASYEAHGGTHGRPAALLFDCISRRLFLEEHFADELEHLSAGLGELEHSLGVLSLGELCNNTMGSIDLLNKSTVVGVC